MAVSASIELRETELLMQQPTSCLVRLENGSGETLRALNDDSARSFPVIELRHESGRTSRCVARKTPGALELPDDVPAGATWEKSFLVPDWLQFPEPGIYEIRAEHSWNGGRVVSEPEYVQVRPAVPRALSVVSASGATSDAAYVAWAGDGAEGGELWLATVFTAGKPFVAKHVRLASVPPAVTPVASVPAAVMARDQWVAFIDGGALHAVRHREGRVAPGVALSLPVDGASIVAPLLLDAAGGAEPAGADALVAAPAPGGMTLWVAHLAADGEPAWRGGVEVPVLRPVWARTAYLADATRRTYMLSAEEDGCALACASWAAGRPPSAPKWLTGFPGRFLDADLRVTTTGAVRGVVMTATGPATHLHAFIDDADGGLSAALPVLVRMPRAEGEIDRAVARIGDRGGAAALLHRAGQWSFAGPDGSTTPLALGVEPASPLDILFRFGDDPAVLHTEGGRGLLFARPRPRGHGHGHGHGGAP